MCNYYKNIGLILYTLVCFLFLLFIEVFIDDELNVNVFCIFGDKFLDVFLFLLLVIDMIIDFIFKLELLGFVKLLFELKLWNDGVFVRFVLEVVIVFFNLVVFGILKV